MAEIAYGIYTLLHTLIDQVGWKSEAERGLAHESVNAMRAMNIFGALAVQMECPHPAETLMKQHRGPVVCGECGRVM